MKKQIIQDYLLHWYGLQVREPTAHELLFAAKLIAHRIQFKVEYPVLNEKSFFTADFYIPKYKLLIEIDGGVHETERQRMRDTMKDVVYRSLGYNVLRIKNNEVEYFELKQLKRYAIQKQKKDC